MKYFSKVTKIGHPMKRNMNNFNFFIYFKISVLLQFPRTYIFLIFLSLLFFLLFIFTAPLSIVGRFSRPRLSPLPSFYYDFASSAYISFSFIKYCLKSFLHYSLLLWISLYLSLISSLNTFFFNLKIDNYEYCIFKKLK